MNRADAFLDDTRKWLAVEVEWNKSEPAGSAIAATTALKSATAACEALRQAERLRQRHLRDVDDALYQDREGLAAKTKALGIQSAKVAEARGGLIRAMEDLQKACDRLVRRSQDIDGPCASTQNLQVTLTVLGRLWPPKVPKR
ncbi:MAG: hypothetical protein KDK03_10985 [Rhodobacteraceae bacterium]|nr:hypothetical protein [Paracoccaceae bacterium]